jgi:hypothetical protein
MKVTGLDSVQSDRSSPMFLRDLLPSSSAHEIETVPASKKIDDALEHKASDSRLNCLTH